MRDIGQPPQEYVLRCVLGRLPRIVGRVKVAPITRGAGTGWA